MSQLAEEAEGKGRRGRKRKNGDLEDGDEDEGDEGREVEREDRAKQREMMKEMRARRAAEKLVEAQFGDEVGKQRSRAKQVEKLFSLLANSSTVIAGSKAPTHKGKREWEEGTSEPNS